MMTSPTYQECLFCRTVLTAANRSREHVFPSWLLDELGIAGNVVMPTHHSSDGRVIEQRRHDLDSLVEGRICACCNNGWMSRLEQAAQPVLGDIISRRLGFDALSDEQRVLIARWVAKTAFMLNSASNYHDDIPRKHFHALYTITVCLPEDIVVVASLVSSDSPLHWVQSPTWFADVSDDYSSDIDHLAKQSYKIGLRFREVAFVVACWPHDEWIYVLDPKSHFPLWSPSGRTIWKSSPATANPKKYDPLYLPHILVRIIQESEANNHE